MRIIVILATTKFEIGFRFPGFNYLNFHLQRVSYVCHSFFEPGVHIQIGDVKFQMDGVDLFFTEQKRHNHHSFDFHARGFGYGRC